MKLILTILAALLLARAECLVQNLTIPNVASEIKITWENQGEKTFFNVRAKLVDVDITNCWIGVGLNDRIEMANTDAVICRYAPKKMYIRHNLNQPSFSAPMDSSNPILGLSNLSLVLNQDTIVCKFARDNVNPANGYYKITPDTKPFLITAWGTGDISYHESNFGASKLPITFPLEEPVTTKTTTSVVSNTSTPISTTSVSTTTSVPNKTDSRKPDDTETVLVPVSTVASNTRVISNTTMIGKMDQNVNSIKAFFMKLFNWLFNLFKSNPALSNSAKNHQ